jgi:hypothetical protein
MQKVERMGHKKTNKMILSVLFIFIGTGCLYGALTAPCEVGSIQTIVSQSGIEGYEDYAGAEQEVNMNLPVQLERGICIYTRFENMLLFLVGAALTTSGTGALVRKLTT